MGDRLAFADRDRGVSTVVGFILIFAMLIILLSMYQALWVPIQNEQVEFDHYQGVSDDMTDLRSAIFEARTNGQPQSSTVTLGTRYPNRVIAVNPPPSTGALETGARRNITMRYQSGGAVDVPAQFPGIDGWDEVYTQFMRYTPEYRELDTGAPIRHEHGILYKDFSETDGGGGLVLQNDGQTLVQTTEDGPNRLTLVPIQGNYSERGVERVTVEPEPGILVSREFEDVNVTVPTDLGESTWESVLADQLPPENVVVDEVAGELTLVLDGTWRIRYAPVGVDGPPTSGERGSTGSEINPASPGDVRLVSVDRRQNANEWVITWENTGGTVNISEARVNFYPGAAESVAYVNDPLADRTVNWNIGSDFQVLDPPIQLPGEDQQTDVTVGFDSVLGGDEWWILTVIFETGEQGMYFISEGGAIEDGGGGGGGGGDTTPPTFGYTQAGAQRDGGGNSAEYVDLQASATDDVAVDRIEAAVYDSGGTLVGSGVFGTSFNGETVQVSPAQSMQGGGNYITVEITAYDTSGNSRTCSGQIDDLYQYIDNNGQLTCDQTATG